MILIRGEHLEVDIWQDDSILNMQVGWQDELVDNRLRSRSFETYGDIRMSSNDHPSIERMTGGLTVFLRGSDKGRDLERAKYDCKSREEAIELGGRIAGGLELLNAEISEEFENERKVRDIIDAMVIKGLDRKWRDELVEYLRGAI